MAATNRCVSDRGATRAWRSPRALRRTPSSSRVRSLRFWISIVFCGIAAGLVGGLLNMGAYALGRRVFAQS